MHEGNCPICGAQANYESLEKVDSTKKYRCDCCGDFEITEDAENSLGCKYKEDVAKISSIIKNREINKKSIIRIFFSSEEAKKHNENCISIDELLLSYPKEMKYRINSVLLNLASLSQYTGAYIKFDDYKKASPILYCDSYDSASVTFILKYLLENKFIDIKDGCNYRTLPLEVRLTVKAWSIINDLLEGNNSNKVFIAMSFDESLNSAYENGIKKAVEKAGYEDVRVDKQEFNDKICDEIVINVRKAKFVVADVTQQKNGVYFEAGYAMGLGKPVIWTCKEEDLKNVHFDTRQYNHIVWKDENDLYQRLLSRIQATIV